MPATKQGQPTPRSWREFTPIRRPKGMRKRADKAWYRNALRIVLDDRYCEDYVYAEGLAWCAISGAVHHAWVVDADGHAIDPTWPEPSIRYWGTTCAVAELDTAKLGGPQITGIDEVAMYRLLDPTED